MTMSVIGGSLVTGAWPLPASRGKRPGRRVALGAFVNGAHAVARVQTRRGGVSFDDAQDDCQHSRADCQSVAKASPRAIRRSGAAGDAIPCRLRLVPG